MSAMWTDSSGKHGLTPSTHVVSGFALAPSVKELVKVVEVVLGVTVALPLGGLSVVCSHSDPPSVVSTSSDKDVATGSVDVALEELGGLLDVEVDIVTADYQSSPKEECWQTYLPPGAPAQFIEASCMRPASPLPPVALGLQVDSCMAKEARRIGGTTDQYMLIAYTKNLPPLAFPYCSNAQK
jgi:hypothetical protein